MRSRRQTDTELNVLNRQHTWMRWVRHGQRVDQRVTIPVSPFNPKIFGELVDDFFNRHAAVTTDLVERLAGTEL